MATHPTIRDLTSGNKSERIRYTRGQSWRRSLSCSGQKLQISPAISKLRQSTGQLLRGQCMLVTLLTGETRARRLVRYAAGDSGGCVIPTWTAPGRPEREDLSFASVRSRTQGFFTRCCDARNFERRIDGAMNGSYERVLQALLTRIDY